MNNSDNPYSGSNGGGGWSVTTTQVLGEPVNRPAQGTGLVGDIATNPASAEPVLDISTAQFMTEVIEYSRTKPVLVDFWAPWCGPCKQLTPALEASIAKAGGRVRLVKMNIDDHPQVAGQMGIQSIPAVVAFVDGQPRDAFMGAKGEREIDQFIENLIGPSGPSPLDEALEQADAHMLAGKYDQAGHIYGEILRQLPENRDALAGYGMAAFESGAVDEARQVLASAGETSGHQRLEALKAAIDLMDQAENVGDFSELEEKVAADPKDHQARLDLAIALNGAGRREEAADHLLEIISRDRQWNEEAARTQMLQFFEAWGPSDPNTLYARRRLSSILFS